MKLAKALIFLSIAVSSAYASDGGDPFSHKRDLWEERLRNASLWLIECGLACYEAGGEEAIKEKLHSDFRLGLYLPPYASEDDDYTAFGITLGGSFFDVSCFYRTKDIPSGKLYELWTVQATYDSVYDTPDETVFYYVISDGFYKPRNIEFTSDLLLHEYRFNDSYYFKVPIDDELVSRKILDVLDKQRARNSRSDK